MVLLDPTGLKVHAEDDALEDAADDDADVEDDADADEDEFKTLEFKASAVWMTSALISDV